MSISKDHYYRLASDLESERISTAATLIKELTEIDTKKEWDYALDRLIKGLSSSRASARIGFSMCLGEILSILICDKQQYTVDEYVDDLTRKLKQSVPKSNGKNERSILFGELFGLQSLLNSVVISNDLKSVKFDSYLKVLRKLIDLSLTKSWIRETCFATIFKSLLTFQITSNPKFESIMVDLLQQIKEAGLILSTEGLLIYLSIPSNRRLLFSTKANITDFKNGDPFSKGNLLLVSKILKDVEVVSSGQDEGSSNKKQKGSWSPTLHFIWTPLMNELLSATTSTNHLSERKHKKQKTISSDVESITFSDFWKACIDDQFFSGAASPERKYRGFEVFNKLLESPTLTSAQIRSSMSPNLMRTLINQSSVNDRLLNKLAKSTLNNLVSTCSNYQDRLLPVLAALIDVSINFDKLSKSKTVNSVILSAKNDDTTLQVVEFLIKLENTVEKDVIKYQIFAVDALLHLIRSNKNIIKDTKIFEMTLSYLSTHAFMKIPDDAKYSAKMAELSRDRMYSVLSEVIASDVPRSDKLSWPYYVLQTVVTKEQEIEESGSESDLELLNKFEGELNELKWEAVEITATIVELKKNAEVDDQLLSCFEILFSIALLQLYSGDEESASIIADLKSTFEENTTQSTGDEPVLVDALIDLMLSYVTQKSTLMKRISLILWDNLIVKVGNSQLDRLFEILLTKENKEGQDKLFNNTEVDETEADDSTKNEHGHDHDDDSHAEDSDMDTSESEEGDSESEDDVEGSDSDASSSNEAIDEKKKNDDDDDDDEDNDDEDDDYESDVESMSDEQMMAIDSTLSQIFKQRRDALSGLEGTSGSQRKQDVADAREMMAFFKSRVLDLLEVFHNKRSNDVLNVELCITLLDLMQMTMEKHVGEKAHKLIKKITKSTYITEGDDGKDTLMNQLSAVHERASTRAKFQAYSTACNQVSLFIVKGFVKSYGNDSLPLVLNVYSKSLCGWADNKADKILSGLYLDLINWLNSKRQ
ncbi:hypothetical protein CANARDRAFT_185564, partial [[Candida] arabinofermentans NRRL YB-2248]